MYRYGDGTPFPLEENFIETLTAAVETCTNAFIPLTELDARRTRAKDARHEADTENARLGELEQALVASVTPFATADKRTSLTQGVAHKVVAAAKQTIVEARRQIDTRIAAIEAQAQGKTVADGILKALCPFFDAHQLPKAQWIMSWDVRGVEPHADAIATSGALAAAFQLDPDPYRGPIRVDQLCEGVIVHMMKKGVFGKAKPAPVDLGKYVMVAFERDGSGELVITLRENPSKTAPGLRFAVHDKGATWVTISPAGDSEGEDNDLDPDDVAPVRTLAERAHTALENMIEKRTLKELSLDGRAIADLSDPRTVPMELLTQLTPLARSLRDKSRMSGELVLKRDIGDGRREELFVPRATLAQQFARLPHEYRRPFEDMGITSEETQPAIQLPILPPTASTIVSFEEKTVEKQINLADLADLEKNKT